MDINRNNPQKADYRDIKEVSLDLNLARVCNACHLKPVAKRINSNSTATVREAGSRDRAATKVIKHALQTRARYEAQKKGTKNKTTAKVWKAGITNRFSRGKT